MVKRNEWWVNNTRSLLAKAKDELQEARDKEDTVIKNREAMERKVEALEKLLAECEGKDTTEPN